MANPVKIGILVLLGIGFFAGLALAGQYAGGMAFAKMQKLPDSVVSVFTLHTYWHEYGTVKAVRKTLVPATLLSVAIPVLPVIMIGLLVLSSRKKISQFGDAKFASLREIREAGLL